jgi:hypothetical protein
MGPTSTQIESHIRQERADLASNLGQIEQKAKAALDWRAQFQKNPLTMMGVALGAGVLLSAATARPSRRRYSPPEERRETGDYRAAQPWANIKGAIVGVAANRFLQFLTAAIPGFREEYRRTETRSGVGSVNL